MRSEPVYRNVGRPQVFLGIEPTDLLGLATFGWLLLTVHRGAVLVNFLVLLVAYGGLRFGKRGKPPGWTLALIRYSVRRRAYLAAVVPDADGRAHPFPHSP